MTKWQANIVILLLIVVAATLLVLLWRSNAEFALLSGHGKNTDHLQVASVPQDGDYIEVDVPAQNGISWQTKLGYSEVNICFDPNNSPVLPAFNHLRFPSNGPAITMPIDSKYLHVSKITKFYFNESSGNDCDSPTDTTPHIIVIRPSPAGGSGGGPDVEGGH